MVAQKVGAVCRSVVAVAGLVVVVRSVVGRVLAGGLQKVRDYPKTRFSQCK